jgi:eukaryotic-like serine/threonine-protein kinase
MAEAQGRIAKPRLVGRYELYGEIAHGGMATVHVGRILSDAGFSRTVAIKRLHPHCARDPYLAAMFVDEARLASRIHHPNVVSTLDVVVADDELFVVMEYVQGESLSPLIRATAARGELIPIDFVSAIGIGVLDGLHAAHEAVNELDEPLGIVHRDVSPQNVLVGVDGVPRLIDFGVAKAAGRVQETREGQLKGKLGYMPPEQFEGVPADRRGDIYSASIVLWEALSGRRLFESKTEAETLKNILRGPLAPPSAYAPHVPPALDEIVMRGLSRNPADRFATAGEMALALEWAVAPAAGRRVGEWVRTLAAPSLGERAKRIVEIESHSSGVNVASFREAEPDPRRRRASHPDVESSVRAMAANEPSFRPRTDRPPSFHARSSRPPSFAPPSSSPPSLDIATPVRPLTPAPVPSSSSPVAPTSGPQLAAPRSAPPSTPAVAPSGQKTAAPAGMGWTEAWDGAAWTAIFRPVSVIIVGLCGVVAVLLAGLVLSQRVFGTYGPVGAGAGLLITGLVLLRVARASHFRVDASNVTIEQKPGGSSMAVATYKVKKFLVMDRGPNESPLDFVVHFLPTEGDTQRVEVPFASEAEARFVAQRLNEMLASVRGGANQPQNENRVETLLHS